MSHLVSSHLAGNTENISIENDYVGRNNNHQRCLKLSGNICKRKCSKSLKRKLKKYKIKYGEEDPDVLDVSTSLSNSLTIKSPDSQNIPNFDSEFSNCDNHKPRNYLFKNMGNRKKCKILTESNRKILEDQIKPDILSPSINIDNEQNHTNAFTLLMDSRNKSIGTNSPGKEKPKNEFDCEELSAKKEIKAKRMLSLQKMCDAKGSIKKQELEEHREKEIKKQLLKRAERLKNMIIQDNSDEKNNSRPVSNVKKPTPNNCVMDVRDDVNSRMNLKKTLQLCNIFESVDEEILSNKVKIKKVSIEDEDFLNKLSPSIRKKENMMSYFKKVPKGIEESDIVISDDNTQNIIKVKFTPKRKKLVKKKLEQDAVEPHYETNHKKEISEVMLPIEAVEKEVINDSRPKRNSKRPAKYVDNIDVDSSDDDLIIFTPKKKRNLNAENLKNKEQKESKKIDSIEEDKKVHNQTKVKLKTSNETKKNKKDISQTHTSKTQEKPKLIIKGVGSQAKLAPIFMSKQPLSISSAEKQAKQKFLHSGIPEKLKKGSSKQQISQISDTFHIVVHVQQAPHKATIVSDCVLNFSFTEINGEKMDINYANASYENFLNINIEETSQVVNTNYNKNELLQYIKKSYNKFPVYRTYHLLRGKSKGEFKDFCYPELDNSIEIINGLASNDSDFIEKLCWVDKYKPNCTKQIIGNFAAIDELKKWLQTWTENLIKSRSQPAGSDGSDFSDFVDSDTDSRDTLRNLNNVLIISGDVGSGKTSCVYAVAAELAIKVIEVNASSKRTGKIMLQDLQEATRSHKVDRGKNSDCSQNVQDVLTNKESHKKRGRPKKVKGLKKSQISSSQKSDLSETPSSQEIVRTDMSLILIDDADIVFDQDDGFCSAISQLIQSSKRPVILVTNSLSCQHLQKFVQYGKIITLQRFLPRMLGVWLDIMCLADTGTCCPGLGKTLLDLFKGDIRKTINYLQFYVSSYKKNLRMKSNVFEGASQELDNKLNIDDECSSMSWSDRECCQDHIKIPTLSTNELIIDNSLQQHLNKILHDSPFHLLHVWWSLPKILYMENISTQVAKNKELHSKEMHALSNMLDMVSFADCMSPEYSIEKDSIGSTLWSSKETASVDETENFEYYNNCDEVRKDIVSDLVMRGLSFTHEQMRYKTSLDISIPGFSVEREQNKVVSRHQTLTSYLNPGVVLDKKALALDYWSTCREICRSENNKTDINTKRNNRFCHYLKSLNILGKNDYFDALSKSLSCCSDNEKL